MDTESLVGQLELAMLEDWEKPFAQMHFRDGDGIRFGDTGHCNQSSVVLLAMNIEPLKKRGIFEAALVGAYTSGGVGNHDFPLAHLQYTLDQSDRLKLLAVGSQTPGPGPFTVYRGVAGTDDDQRRIHGLSWTLSLDVACQFATRSAKFISWKLGREDVDCCPEVYMATVCVKDVYFFWDLRGEQEVVCRPRRNGTAKHAISIDEMRRRAECAHCQQLGI